MKIALLHYHLKPGGVTTVIRQQAGVLKKNCRLCLLVGDAGSLPPSPDTFILPQLAYRETPCHPEKAADEILATIEKALGGPCDVLHVHNPTLTKNVSLLKILRVLQNRGVRLLLQIHDFAEDGRPRAYSREPYPGDCHYAVINTRDRRILMRAGLLAEGTHFLPNMVDQHRIAPRADTGSSWVLYPIRAIRRKNIGEAILLSFFLPPRTVLGITLPPNSATDLESYHSWKSFCQNHQLRIEFELGNRFNFGDLVQNARYIITTSIAEGFGFSFLEPWLYGKKLYGRRLPAICNDFEKGGVSLQHLYSRLRVPIVWLNEKEFFRKWSEHLRRAALQLDHSIPEQRLRTAFATLTGAGDIDFGLLDESTQKEVIQQLIKHDTPRHRLLAYNPHLGYLSKPVIPDHIVENNRRAILSHFSADGYRRRLLDIYNRVISNDVIHCIDKRRLKNEFFKPSGGSLLRWDT